MLRAAETIVRLIWTHPSNHGRRVKTLLRAILWQGWKRTVARPVNLRFGSLKLRCHPDSGDAGRAIYFNALPDPDEMLFLKHLLRPGDNAVDAGANIGLYTLFLADLVKTGTVLSFEPDSTCAGRLRENVRLNGLDNVVVRQAAVSDRAGRAEFSSGEDEAGAFTALRKSDATQIVDVVRLADEIDGTRFAVGKMDVEGAEPAALRGAELKRHNPPVWLIELTRRTLRRSGTSLEEVVGLLKENGYSLWRYDSGARELIEWTERPREPGHVGDAIAIADDHLDEVRTRLRS